MESEIDLCNWLAIRVSTVLIMMLYTMKDIHMYLNNFLCLKPR